MITKNEWKKINKIFKEKIKENHPHGLIKNHTVYQIWQKMKKELKVKT